MPLGEVEPKTGAIDPEQKVAIEAKSGTVCGVIVNTTAVLLLLQPDDISSVSA